MASEGSSLPGLHLPICKVEPLTPPDSLLGLLKGSEGSVPPAPGEALEVLGQGRGAM